MNTLLLTGGRGMVGSEVLRYFRMRGWRAIVACSGRVETCDDAVEVIPFDLSAVAENTALEAAMRKVTAVVHCAALLPSGGLLRTSAGARQLYDLNSLGSYNLMQMAVCNDVRQFVYISTANLYGSATIQIEESMIATPTDSYMLSKLACEEAAKMFGRSSKTRFIGLRISAPYGAAFNIKAVIPTFVQRAFAGEALELQGSGKREQVFTYVGDIARACFSAVTFEASGICNIAGPGPVTMAQLAQSVIKAVGNADASIKFSGDPDPNEGARRQISIAHAKQLLNWEPTYDLDRGLEAMVAHLCNPPPAILRTIPA
ncbi:NAD-dependent epimerase/dehydratase family protein [Undibacter mobilis]|uniref:NAD(P)-dependent oxidoreductase n=1 Tax=Undibacter mobilis TaxID=2292256 RepID=A0A371B6F0_9BRAD|nr:NAD(P)-dependent oxidoreductase [Undibacter mobilis]RDV03169.1 NAD(P)-dependent oxidoreductase [Undibacter mobilis]